MKLPNIEQSNLLLNKTKKGNSLIKEKYKIIQGKNDKSSGYKVDSLRNKMKEINEIRIYLKESFERNEVDDLFLKDIEKEFAEQYLIKMKIFPTKKMINKVLQICPLKNCDFELNNEYVYVNNKEKFIKVIHIYPVYERKDNYFKTIDNATISFKKRGNTISNEKSNYFQTLTVTENNLIFNRLNKKHFSRNDNKYKNLSIEATPRLKNFFGTANTLKFRNRIYNQRKNNNSLHTYNGLLYNREAIDDILIKNQENVANIQLFSNQKSTMKINLSPENIKEKYISSESNWSNQAIENKGKLTRISKSILTYKNIINNEKYFFRLEGLDKGLTREIMDEVNEPINVQIELIIKDINYILDNFPLDNFIQKKNENLNFDLQKEYINKITVKNNEELIKILKIIESNDSCRIIAICINLIYWIIFGGNAQIQIDNSTKECLYLKLMKEWENIGNQLGNKKLFYKVYTPLFIIICRIETENLLTNRYKNLFLNEKAKKEILKKANAIISEIFDKHGYMNSFTLLCGNQTEFTKKFKPNCLPRYKNKLYATSNFVDILFRNDINSIRADSFEEAKAKKNFISKQKVEYFNFYLDKMNNMLKKRNLAPIFKIKKKANEVISTNHKALLSKKELNLSGINKFENNENIKITDYIAKTKEDYIKKFSEIKKRFSTINNNI
jgi:hypothetical protein